MKEFEYIFIVAVIIMVVLFIFIVYRFFRKGRRIEELNEDKDILLNMNTHKSTTKVNLFDTDEPSISPHKEEIQKLLDGVMELIQPKADERGLILITDVSQDLAYFNLEQTINAVYNIVDNAIKYTSSGRCIMIRTMIEREFLRIDIMDEGIGIMPEEHVNIFTQYYSPKVKNEQDGAGVGLFTAKEIITKQGGYIEVSSNLGEGAVFSVFLPTDN